MYNHIRGRLIEKNPAFVVIEANGIGYHIHISLNTYTRLSSAENAILYTHLVIREDNWQMFGFIDTHERHTFLQLISVSGVGPNTARVLLSSLKTLEVEQAILREDVQLLTAVKGIGAKTAQRIVVDLRDKIGKSSSIGMVSTGSGSQRLEAVSALEILGFNRLLIDKVVSALLQTKADMTVEEIVKEALKKL